MSSEAESTREIRDSTLRMGQELRPKFFRMRGTTHVKEVNAACGGGGHSEGFRHSWEAVGRFLIHDVKDRADG